MIQQEILRHVLTALSLSPTAEQKVAAETFADFLSDTSVNAVMVMRGSAGTGKTSLAAAVVKAKREFGLDGGILITNPIPEEYSMDPEAIQKVIDQALAEMDGKGIKGKECTPFLLARITEITGGESLASNIQLVYNNAAVGTEIAAAYCRLVK